MDIQWAALARVGMFLSERDTQSNGTMEEMNDNRPGLVERSYCTQIHEVTILTRELNTTAGKHILQFTFCIDIMTH